MELPLERAGSETGASARPDGLQLLYGTVRNQKRLALWQAFRQRWVFTAPTAGDFLAGTRRGHWDNMRCKFRKTPENNVAISTGKPQSEE
jgi:hypothetical protein